MCNRNFLQKSLFIFGVLGMLLPSQAVSQELNVEVTVNRSQIKGTALNYLDQFDEEIEAYLNGYNWTNDNFGPQEQINAQLQIFLTSVSANFEFTAKVVIQSTRPVYNTDRQTTLLLYNDDAWVFQYLPGRALIHDELRFDAVTTLLNFYAYLILGYDYDSFEVLGGTPWFTEAQNQVSVAQTSLATGWRRSSTQPNNRAQLSSDLTNPNYELLRRAFYKYHRHGLDLFIKNPQQARQNMLETLSMIQRAKQQTVNNLLFDIFFNTKYLELTAMFKDAAAQVRNKAYQLLSEMDVSHLNTYRQLQ